MPELVFELLSEEIPARMQLKAADLLREKLVELKDELGFVRDVPDAAVTTYVTPRRLAGVIKNLPHDQPDDHVERKGPRVGSPDAAIQGFLKSVGFTNLDQCEKRVIGKAEFWFATMFRKGRPTAEVLAEALPEIVYDFDWPKSMRWANGQVRWVRPIQSVLAVFDGKRLDGAIGLATTDGGEEIAFPFSDRTRGHRFLRPGAFAVASFADYAAQLRDHHVILDQDARREAIWRDARLAAELEGLTVKEDPGLLDEVTGLVEWPVVLIGAIDPEFMALPPEVLSTSMRTHQKYFSLLAKDGTLAPRFLVVANMLADDGGKAIVAGNERVLRARLADARFFWDQDRKARLESRVPALRNRVFHARLGTMEDKVMRMQALAAALVPYVPESDVERARSAALLCKADLSTGMVGEFPELQGVMGRYYALGEGEDRAIADAIADHYSPLGPSDRCPTAPTSIVTALADKIDTLVGFFAIAEKPTGSKDPFALRRAALGVFRLIIENRLRLPLDAAFSEAFAAYRTQRHQGFEDAVERAITETSTPGESVHESIESAYKIVCAADVRTFIEDRVKVYLRDQGVRHDLISAVFALGGEDDLVRLLTRVDALEKFLASEDGADLLTAYRRASNIVGIEEKRDGLRYDGAVDATLLTAEEERKLARVLDEVRDATATVLPREDFHGAMQALALLRQPVDAFFDRVTVNCPERPLRANRLRLLSAIRATLGQVADFAKIEG